MKQLGPYELNQIYCGECSELMAGLPADSIDLTVTSPPYDSLRTYRGYTFNFEAIARQLYRVTKPGGVVVWVVADETKDGSESGTSFRQALYFMGLGFNLHDTMIYERVGPPSVAILQKRYEQHFEYMFIFSKGFPVVCNHIRQRKSSMNTGRSQQGQREVSGSKTIYKPSSREDKIAGNIWRYNVGGNGDDPGGHPATFPEALARDHILSWTNPGDLVLDPMTGSGTTPKMAYLTGRNFLGFEISEEYTDLARRRLEATMSQPALFNPYQVEAQPQPIQIGLGV